MILFVWALPGKIENSKRSVRFQNFIVLWCLAALNDYFGVNKSIEDN
jgi:hypothetical protein